MQDAYDPDASDSFDYEVECVVDVRKRTGNRWDYKVVWKNYPGEDSWEEEENLQNAKLKLLEFQQTDVYTLYYKRF